jgi:acyl-coenzyme A thioesterase PaaI-like protein
MPDPGAQAAALPLSTTEPAGNRLLHLWRRLGRLPAGRWLFGKLVGWRAPYTGSIGARVLELARGHARLALRERRKVRNHLRSIHAAALFNLAEETSGLAMLSLLPDTARGIPIALSIEYLKKARGRIFAECRAAIGGGDETREERLAVELRDLAGDVVARAEAVWRVGPR